VANIIPIKDVEFLINDKCLVLRFRKEWFSLSSAVLNGGFRKVKAIANYQVDKDFSDEKPEDFLKKVLRNLPKPTVGLMTAADITKFSLKSVMQGKLSICALVTAGVSNAASAGEKIKRIKGLGTINIIVLVDGCLSESCMVNLIGTITEAKSMALIDLDVRSRFSGELASGTTTDAIVVACAEKGEEIKYAGTGTELGMLTGRIVRKAVRETIQNQGLYYPNRPLIKRLEERGVALNQIMNLIYRFSPELKSFSRDDLKKFIENELKNINVASLVIAGLRLEEDKARGLIPGVKRDGLMLINEMFGMHIAKLIGGEEAVQEFLKINKTKLNILRIGVFSRSVINGLLAGISSKLKRIEENK
jgi:iron complex transport system ATP-binding protein